MGFYKLLPGNEWNPLRKHRNINCPCKSGKKAKRCHGLPEFVGERAHAWIKIYLAANRLETLTEMEVEAYTEILKRPVLDPAKEETKERATATATITTQVLSEMRDRLT